MFFWNKEELYYLSATYVWVSISQYQ